MKERCVRSHAWCLLQTVQMGIHIIYVLGTRKCITALQSNRSYSTFISANQLDHLVVLLFTQINQHIFYRHVFVKYCFERLFRTTALLDNRTTTLHIIRYELFDLHKVNIKKHLGENFQPEM
jgi:hypothetical protein